MKFQMALTNFVFQILLMNNYDRHFELHHRNLQMWFMDRNLKETENEVKLLLSTLIFFK